MGSVKGSLGMELVKAPHAGSLILGDLLEAGPRAEGSTEGRRGVRISPSTLLHHCAEGWSKRLVLQ